MPRSAHLRAFLISLALVAPAASQNDRELVREIELPLLSTENLGDWAKHIQPDRDELGAESIDWIPDFAQGVLEASRQEKPLLFWAMNGHPLGCT